MAPSRRKGASKAAAAAAARRQWKVGDLVLAKVKGFPAWPATVSEPEKWGYSSDWKKVLVYFFGTKQIAFCNPADVEEFTEEKKVSLLGKRQGRGADFVRAVQEIVDCYDKLKENAQVDGLNSGEAPAENAASGNQIASNTTEPDAAHNSRFKSSNSSRPKDEATLANEDVGAITEVDSLHQRGIAEEPADNDIVPSMPMPNTYALRKKSRSTQLQRCASQKKASAQRSRSSLRFDSYGLQNGVSKSSDGQNSGERSTNGFWDGPLRRAKRSKRSPEGSVPDVGDSPICNSNGTIDDNRSEVAMVESESLSNNECSAIESNHKNEQSEVLNESSEAGLQLSRRLDLQAKTAIVKKKRNTGRKRIMNDGVEFALRPDQDVNVDIGFKKDTSVVPNPKDEGDEHLPLVKRARVRMGKLLSEEQQLDFLVKSEGKSLQPATSAFGEASTSLNCDGAQSQPNILSVNDSITCSPADNCTEVPENKTQPENADSSGGNQSLAYSQVGNFAHIPKNEPQPWKGKTSQPFTCVFDGEAALPPSKRLHRALEAMSANAAEESRTPMEVPLSPKKDSEDYDLSLVKLSSDKLVEDAVGNNFELPNKSLDCNNDDCSGARNSSNLTICEVTNKTATLSMSDSSTRILDSMKVKPLKDNTEEVTVCTHNKDLSGLGGTEASHHVHLGEASQVMVTSIEGSKTMLASESTVLTQLPVEDFSKSGEEEVHQDVAENKKPDNVMHSEQGRNPTPGEEEVVIVGSHDGISVDFCDNEARCCAPTEFVKTSVDEIPQAASICEAAEEVKHSSTEANINASVSPLVNPSSSLRTCHGASVSGGSSHLQDDTCITTNTFPAKVDVHKLVSPSDDITHASTDHDNLRHNEHCATDTKLPQNKQVSDDESKILDAGMHHHTKIGERTNLAEVKAALASLELTLGSLTRTKESIGRATRIAVDCVKFGVAAEVVELLVLYLEKESSLYRRVDLFFLVDSIAQCSRGLKGEVGGTYISAVKETLARMVSAAAPPGHAARENRRQCLKVLRLWLDRRILPDFIIRQHIRELESQNCSSSTGGYSRRMSRTERSFDDPLRDMEGMLVDEYGSNSSFQLPGFCMPRMLKEEDDGSDSDGGSFEAVTPEHDHGNNVSQEATAPAIEKHRHILEDVDGELEMEDVAPSCDAEMGPAAPTVVDAGLNTHRPEEQFTPFVPPLPHDVPPRVPPLPTSPPPVMPPPPPPPLPPPPPPPPQLHPHASNMSHMQESMSSRPPAVGVHHPMQMPESTTSGCSFNSYHYNSGNNPQPADTNLYNKGYNHRPPYPSPSNQFSYFQAEQHIRPPREVPPPSYYDRPHFGHTVEGGHFYGDQDCVRPPRHEMTDGWGYSRPPFPSPSCEPRVRDHRWAYPPRPMHHRNHIPNRPPCDGAVPVAVRAPGYWQPR